MKKIIYAILKPVVHARASRLKEKQDARLNRLKEAEKYLNDWNDIPLDQQMPALCRILKIKNNYAAKKLMINVLVRQEPIEKLARKLPLI